MTIGSFFDFGEPMESRRYALVANEALVEQSNTMPL
jgi:hypothetical protein